MPSRRIAAGERTGDAGTVADISLGTGTPVIGMNPAHILYQCLTDTSFGMGYSPATINEASFEAAADQFHSEGLGLCMHWTQQEPIEAFMQRVIDHAGAALVQHPATGLFELVPLRGNYDVGSLPVFDASNIDSVLSYQKPSPAEATNEVTVRFGDVAAGPGKAGSVRVQNLANITSQGGVVSKTVQYPGAFYAALALRLAMRDLKAVSTPQAKVRLRVQRKAWSLTRGAVFVFNWPKLSISGMVLRVLSINYGSLTDAMIEIDAAEDVYSMPATTYGAEQPSGWVAPVTSPQAAADRLVREAGYYEAQLLLGATEAQALDETAGFVIAAAARPSGAALDFGMRTRVGSEAYAERDRSAFAPSGTLDAAIDQADTEATIVDLLDGALVLVGSYAQIDDEIVRIDAWDAGTGEIELGRGVLGTVAATHDAGARVFFLSDYFAADDVERIESEEVDVKLLTRTGQGELAESDAPVDTVTIAGNIARPYPPGQLRINALAYPSTVDIADFTISWAHRDRLQQNLEGDESGNIGPEDGTTYTVELTDADTDEALHTETGITGTSYEVDGEDIDHDRNVRVRVWAVRDGLASAQRHDVVIAVTGLGAPVGSAWDPANKDADVTLSGSDTIATVVSAGSIGGAVRGTQARNASDDRCFVIHYTGPDGRCCPGIVNASASLSSYPGEDTHGRGYYGLDGRKQHNGGSEAYGSTYGNGAQVLVRLHGGTLTFYLWSGSDWTSQGTAYSGLTGDYYPAWGPGSTLAGTRAAEIQTVGITSPPSGSADWG